MTDQASHIYPPDLFAHSAGVPSLWSCVCTRPRWEKKFSRWLISGDFAHFLPLVNRRTVSHRRTRIHRVPLFPGYVFVAGEHRKNCFSESGCVVRVLLPATREGTGRLARDIQAIHSLLETEDDPEIVSSWTPGQWVRIINGPMAETVGQYIGDGAGGKLLVWVELLGVGATVSMPPQTAMEAVSG